MLVAGPGANCSAVFNASGLADAANGANFPPAVIWMWNGASFDRCRVTSAVEMVAATKQFAQMVSNPGEWQLQNNPGANTQATASKAAGGAGVRHILRSFTISLSSTAAAASQQTVVIRDGASGAGTVLYTFSVAIPATADSGAVFGLSNLSIFGSANTAMTIEFTVAGGANTFETVSASGISTI